MITHHIGPIASGFKVLSGVSYPVSLGLINPGAETGSASGWTAAAGGSLWSSDDRITVGFPNSVYDGSRYFWAGANANARMYQDVDVSAYASDIDAGLVVGELTARFTTNLNFGDYLSMFIRALDASDTVIKTVSQEELTSLQLSSGWRSQDLNMLLPSGTRKIRIEFHATRTNGTDNDVFLDAITLDLYENDRRITPTYGSPISRGNRTSLITMSATNLVGFGTLSSMVDGANANNYFFNGVASNGTGWLTFDFGSGKSYVIDEFIWKQQNTTGHGVWRLEGSPDNTNWTQIGSDFTLTGGIIQPGGANSTAYRYYRLRAMSGSRSSGPYLYEIVFRAR